jgi:hypothetical protein
VEALSENRARAREALDRMPPHRLVGLVFGLWLFICITGFFAWITVVGIDAASLAEIVAGVLGMLVSLATVSAVVGSELGLPAGSIKSVLAGLAELVRAHRNR